MSTVLPISIVVAPSFTMVALRGRNLLICTRYKRIYNEKHWVDSSYRNILENA